MSVIALLEYIPRTGSLASQHHLAASWLCVRLLARALCHALSMPVVE